MLRVNLGQVANQISGQSESGAWDVTVDGNRVVLVVIVSREALDVGKMT